jgi:integrase
MSLTDLQIKRMKAPDKGQQTYFDDAVRGFGVRVSQGGSKTFVVLLGKARKRRTIGRYPDISLSEARAMAKRAQADFLLDGEVIAETKPTISFSNARDRFLADCDVRTKPRTAAEYRRLLYSHFSFDKSVDTISRTSITDAIEAIRNTPSEQKHAFVAIRTMMNWCRKRGIIEASPVPALSFTSEPRSRVLSDDELRAVWRRAEGYGYPYGRIIQLLVLTGQRRGEIAGLRCSWIEGDVIVFPPGFTKNKREHVVPLGAHAMQIVAGLPESSDLLFPARGAEDRPFNGWSKSKLAFDNGIEVPDYTLHDLRRTFSSTMARLATPIHVTEKLLNHVSGTISGVAAIYNRHSYLGEMRQAIAAYDDHLASLTAE